MPKQLEVRDVETHAPTLVGANTAVQTDDLHAWFDQLHALRGITLNVPERQVTAIIGPSGCGKSTFLRCLNRMHELVPSARVSGTVRVHDQDIYAPGIDPVLVRRRVGMVFQKPNPLPTMNIYDNVAAGGRLAGEPERRRLGAGGRRSRHPATLREGGKGPPG